MFLGNRRCAHKTVFICQRQRKTVRGFLELGPQTNAAVTGFFVQHAYPVHVTVAVDFQALAQVFELSNVVLGEYAPDPFFGMHAFGTVDVYAHQFFLQVVVAQTVAVVDDGALVVGLKFKPFVTHLRDPANGAPRRLRGVEGANVVLATVDKVVGELAVEVLVRIGVEGERGGARGRACQWHVRELTLLHDAVQQLAVMRRNVLDVTQILVAALDLETAHTGIYQGTHVVGLVVVLHR